MTKIQIKDGVTPLQEILGVEPSEEVYDLLDIRDQIILDLVIAGWTQQDIAEVLCLSQSYIAILLKQIRYKLVDSTLQEIIDIRQQFREENANVAQRRVLDNGEGDE